MTKKLRIHNIMKEEALDAVFINEACSINLGRLNY